MAVPLEPVLTYRTESVPTASACCARHRSQPLLPFKRGPNPWIILGVPSLQPGAAPSLLPFSPFSLFSLGMKGTDSMNQFMKGSQGTMSSQYHTHSRTHTHNPHSHFKRQVLPLYPFHRWEKSVLSE